EHPRVDTEPGALQPAVGRAPRRLGAGRRADPPDRGRRRRGPRPQGCGDRARRRPVRRLGLHRRLPDRQPELSIRSTAGPRGPAVTLAIFAGCCAALLATGVSDLGGALKLDFVHTTPAKGLLSWLAGVNLVVLLFNLLPAYPLDGSRIVRALVWRVTGDPNRG